MAMVEVTNNMDMSELLKVPDSCENSEGDLPTEELKSHDITNGNIDEKKSFMELSFDDCEEVADAQDELLTHTETVDDQALKVETKESAKSIDDDILTSNGDYKDLGDLHDTGNDLDALLDKISTAVECEAEKNSNDKINKEVVKEVSLTMNGSNESAKATHKECETKSGLNDIDDIFEDAIDSVSPLADCDESKIEDILNISDDVEFLGETNLELETRNDESKNLPATSKTEEKQPAADVESENKDDEPPLAESEQKETPTSTVEILDQPETPTNDSTEVVEESVKKLEKEETSILIPDEKEETPNTSTVDEEDVQSSNVTTSAEIIETLSEEEKSTESTEIVESEKIDAQNNVDEASNSLSSKADLCEKAELNSKAEIDEDTVMPLENEQSEDSKTQVETNRSIAEEIQAPRSNIDDDNAEIDSDDDVLLISEPEEPKEDNDVEMSKENDNESVEKSTNMDSKPANNETENEKLMTEEKQSNSLTKAVSIEQNETESDDEVVFFEPVEKKSECKPNDETETKVEESKKPILVKSDDDVVLILEDDDDVTMTPITKEAEADEKATNKMAIAADSGIVNEDSSDQLKEKPQEKQQADEIESKTDLRVDNSDNACDNFEKNANEAKTTEVEESNSNSSSNLLRPGQKPVPSQDESCTSAAAADDGDVELIDDEELDEATKAPPIKRLRLSVDSNENSKKNTVADSTTTEVVEKESSQASKNINDESSNSSVSLKRIHASSGASDSGEGQSKATTPEEDVPIKKTKIETVQEVDKKTETEIAEEATKPIVETSVSVEPKEDKKEAPIKLYPAPNVNVNLEPIKLEFFNRFRKTFDKMTKTDLEEIVLQKVVEAIQFKSEFAEIRDQLDKQEKTLTSYRKKVADVTKQFLDLEMVHKRLISDLETKNSQFVMPVKITRAVGLQVGPPYKKILEATMAATNNAASSAQLMSQMNAMGQRSPQTQRAAPLPVMPSVMPGLAAVKPQPLPVSAMPTNVRRGCVQKITPQRPVPPSLTNSPNNIGMRGMSSTTAAVSVQTQATQIKTPPKVVGKNTPLQQAAALAAAAATRNRLSTPVTTNDYAQQQAVRHALTLSPLPTANKPIVNPNMRRPDAMPGVTTTIVNVPNAALTDAALMASNLMTARPKEKAVIDLTDEDESVEALMRQQQIQKRPQPQAPMNVATRQRTPGLRPIAPRPTNPPNTRGPMMPQRAQQPPTALRQTTASQITRMPPNPNLPPGTNITRVQLSANYPAMTRVKYSHPAPLPVAPPQTFNPDWKLLPPRPTIRISLLENGIVISWTMEESLDRFAECVSYQIYAYQETSQPPSSDLWRHVGDVKAMLLPMAVTLNQFQENQRYYFAVRAVDEHRRYGQFSVPKTWT